MPMDINHLDTIDLARFDMARPLLVVKAPKGYLACVYINPQTCDKTGEACAIVSGVNNLDDMKAAKIIAVSKKAEELGIHVGGTGEAALIKMR